LTLDAPRVVIGRSKSCEVQLPDPSVSLRHASIRLQGGKNLVVDEGSTNGIVVGNVRLPPHTPRAVSDGELVRVGRVWLELRFRAGMPSSPKQARAIALDYLRRELKRQGEPTQATLRVATGPDAGKCIVLGDDTREYVVGRSGEADLVLAEEAASRRHLALGRHEGRWCVRDLGSKAGTLLDDEPLSTAARGLSDGSRIELGDDLLLFEDPLPQHLTEMQAAADVQMRREEYEEGAPGTEGAPLVEAPPEVAEPLEEEPSPTPEPAESPESPLEPRGAAFASVDLLVVLVALGLLALSIVGLMYILG
jgi:pSer/pThr/pTyr-binding forkhead associated (FHA) protein